MARVKLTEHDAKRLLFPVFDLNYQGISLSSDNPDLVGATLPAQAGLAVAHICPAVLKVDQGVKKRGKQGLVKLNIQPKDLTPTLAKWRNQGYSQFLLEPMVEHKGDQEKYLSCERTRDGWLLSHSDLGGVEIESHWDSVTRTVLNRNSRLPVEKGSPAGERTVLAGFLPPLITRLDQLHISFLEINPYIIQDKQIIPLDMAVEIDSAGIALAERATNSPIIPIANHNLTSAESRIAELDASTPAALKFRFLNPDGRIWMLLSGGGASLVLADEVADLGLGDELANYGEYSGAPSADDTYAYTKIILEQILKTTYLPAKVGAKRAIIIAGGVANFTDVVKTFTGIIRALGEVKGKLAKLGVKVYVRRGGPNEEVGLKLMKDFLTSANLLGSVHGHTSSLTEVVTEVKEYLS